MKNPNIAVVYIEFDLEEGPQFKIIIPATFPIDQKQEFEISNYALYSEGIFQLDTEDFEIFGFTFRKKVQSNRTDHTKASIAFLISKRFKKIKRAVILDFIETEVPKIIKKVAKQIDLPSKEILLKLLEKFEKYINSANNNRIGEDIKHDRLNYSNHSIRDNKHIKNLEEKILLIIDLIAKNVIVISSDDNIFNKFTSKDKKLDYVFNKIEFFDITDGNRFLIYSTDHILLKNAIMILNHVERDLKMVTIDDIKKILKID